MSPLHIALLTLSFAGQPNGILLDFSASYCGPCQEMSPMVSRLEREGYPIRKVDVQQEPQLASQFRITSIPCFVLVVNGAEVTRVVGRTSEQNLKQMMAQIPMREAPVAVAQAAPSTAPARSPNASSQDAPLFESKAAPASRSMVTLPPATVPVVSEPAVSQATVTQPVANQRTAPQYTASQPPVSQLGDSQPAVAKTEAPRKPKRGFAFFSKSQPEAAPVGERVVRAKLGDVDPQVSVAAQQATGPMASSVRVRIKDTKGENFGSGTIIQSDVGRTIVLTCGHIFRNLERKGTIEVDVFNGEQFETFVGKLVRVDEEADVGLISIPTDTPLPVCPIAPEGYKVLKDSPVISIGCGGGELPSRHNIRVTAVNRYLGPDNLECSDVPAQGRSGGGLFTREGAVIGICTAADRQESRGLYAGLKAVHTLLDQAQLSHLYGKETPAAIDDEQLAATEPAADAELPATDEEELLGDEETLRNALKEVGHAEIVCVIRPINQPRSKSKVVVINRASPRFVSYLTDEVQTQNQVRPTTLNVAEELVDAQTEEDAESLASTLPVAATRPSRNQSTQRPSTRSTAMATAAKSKSIASAPPSTRSSATTRAAYEAKKPLSPLSPLPLNVDEQPSATAPKPYRRSK